jgi:phosphohistidine phosphatase
MIYFLRHGEAAKDGDDDAARELTEKGKRQSEDAGRALEALGASIDVCLTSPKARAEQTARIACKQLGVDVEIAEELRGGSFDAQQLTAGRGDVLLVGHEPDFSNAISELTGGRVKLRKGGVACVEDGMLHNLQRPRDLRRIAGT